MTSPLDPDSVAIGRAARAALAGAGYTQEQAAPELGMSLQTLSRRINGNLPFTWPELARLAVLTGTTLTQLAEHAERISQASAASPVSSESRHGGAADVAVPAGARR